MARRASFDRAQRARDVHRDAPALRRRRSLRNSSRSAMRRLPSRSPAAAKSLLQPRVRLAGRAAPSRRARGAGSRWRARDSSAARRPAARAPAPPSTASVAVGVLSAGAARRRRAAANRRARAPAAPAPRAPLCRSAAARCTSLPRLRRAHGVAELAVDDAGVALPRLDAFGPRRHLGQRPLQRHRRLGPLAELRVERASASCALLSFLSSLTMRSSRSAACAASPCFS